MFESNRVSNRADHRASVDIETGLTTKMTPNHKEMRKQCNFDLLDEGCIFFNAVCKYFPTKLCNPNKNYIVRTAGVMIMHGGIRYLLTGAAEDEKSSLSMSVGGRRWQLFESVEMEGWTFQKK